MSSEGNADEQAAFLTQYLLQEPLQGDQSRKADALSLLENMSDAQLDTSSERVALTPEVVSFLRAVLFGCDLSTQSEQVFRRRHKCFETAIGVLKGGCLNQHGCRELIELLGAHARQLYSEQTLSLVDSLLDGGPVGGPSSLTMLLDLLPVLVGDSKDCREYSVEKLYDMVWPRELVLGYTSALVGMCVSDAECERAMTKIMSYLVHSPDTGSRRQSGGNAMHEIDPEELPVLVYHLTSISRKCASSSSLKASLLEVVAESLDSMLTVSQGDGAGSSVPPHVRRMRPVLATIMHHLTTMLTKDQGIADELLALVKTRRMATGHSMCFHQTGTPLLSSSKLLLALLSSKTPRNEMKALAALTEFVQETFTLGPVAEVSIWFQPMIWSKVICINAAHLCHVFDVLLSKCSLMQLEATSAPLVNLAFLLMSTPSTPNPGDIGAHGSASGGGGIKASTRDSLLQGTLQYAPPHQGRSDVSTSTRAPSSPGTFGAWLICNIFIHSEHTRTQIARELVVRLLVHAQVTTVPAGGTKQTSTHKAQSGKHPETSSASMPPPSAPTTASDVGHTETDQEVALLCVSILENLSVDCPKGIMSVAVDLQESFAALPELAGSTAARLVTVLGGYFGTSPGLSDRCTLALRKSGFARDTVHRKAAVYSLIALLRLHFHSATLDEEAQRSSSRFFPPGGASSSSQLHGMEDSEATVVEIDMPASMSSQQTSEQLMAHSVTSGGVGAFIGISVDEILSMCRRFFSWQRVVRVSMYNLIVQVQLDFPSSRGMALRMLGNHLSSLVLEDKYDLSWSVSAAARSRQSSASSQSLRVPDAEYSILHPEKYVDIVSGSPEESLSDLLSSALMLACPFDAGPHELLLTGLGSNSSGKRHAGASQWDSVDISFIKSQTAPPQGVKVLSSSEIFLLHDARRFTSRRVCDDGDSVETRNLILKICKGLTDTPLTQLHIPPRIPDGGASIPDQFRVFSLMEILHTAMSCAMSLPDATFVDCDGIDLREDQSVKFLSAAASRPRLKLLNYLCAQAELVTSLAVGIRKSSKNTGLFPSLPKSPHMSSPMLRFVQSANMSVLGSMCSIFQRNMHNVGCPSDMHSGLHLFVSEYQFAFDLFTVLNAEDDEVEPNVVSPVMINERAAGSNIGAAPAAPSGIVVARITDVLTPENLNYLESHVLERCVVMYECTLTLLSALLRCERVVDIHGPRSPVNSESKEGADRSGVLWAWWGWFAIRAVNVRLFGLLLTFFRRQRTRDRGAAGKRASASGGDANCVFSNKQFSKLQLVLRAMLGSLRVEVSISHVISKYFTKNDSIAGISCSPDDTPSNSGLVILLEHGFEGVMRSRRDGGPSYGSMLTQRLGIDGSVMTQNIASTAYTQDGEGGANTQWVHALQTHIKNFGKLFLAMHDMEAEKAECPAIVSILAELFDVLVSVPAAQKDSADNFLRYCKEKLVNPNGNLCKGLMQLIVLHAAPDPADRLRRALQCGLMIKIAAQADREGDIEADSDAEDEPLFLSVARGPCTSVLVSHSSMHHAAGSIVQMMEKACNEVELLYKLARKESLRFEKKSSVVYAWIPAHGDRGGGSGANPHELNTIICATLLRVVHVLEKLLQHELSSSSVKLLGVIVKMYKFLVKLTKEITSRVNKGIEAASACVIPMYRTLCSRVVDKLATKLSDYLMYIRNSEYSGEHDDDSDLSDDGDGGPRHRNKVVKKTTVNQRLKKLVPDVIYQIEQLDVMFIRLSGALRGAGKVIVSKWVRRTAVCDFKLKAGLIDREQLKAERVEKRKNDRKRKKTQGQEYEELLDEDENRTNYRRIEDTSHDDFDTGEIRLLKSPHNDDEFMVISEEDNL